MKNKTTMGWGVALPLFWCLITPITAQENNENTFPAESPNTTQTENPATESKDEIFLSAVNALNVKSFKQKEQAISALLNTNDIRSIKILEALLDAKLYYRKSDKRVVIVNKLDGQYELIDPATQIKLGTVAKRKTKKIRVNNKLRKQIKTSIAKINFSSPDVNLRLAAVKAMMENITTESAIMLKQAKEKETNKEILQYINVSLALEDIHSDDKYTRLQAIQTLGDSLIPQASNELNNIIQKSDDGEYLEHDVLIRDAAIYSLKRIKDKQDTYHFLETIFFGLSLGSVLLLAAIGLAITFGVMGVINMAHGELIMLGAYTTYIIQLLMPNSIGMSLFLAIPAAFLVSGMFGIAIERGVIRHLYGRPLETLLATFGVSLILQQLVRTTISAQNVAVETPAWMSGSLEINAALSLTYNRIYILIFALLVFALLLLILKKTLLGLQVRAVSQNRAMAKAIGIRTQWVDSLTFGLGSGIAGVAGVALSQLTNVGPNLGQSYIIDSFLVVVFGGVGNLWGTFVGAMSLGVVNKFLEPWAGAVLAKILVLIFIILFIQKRPKGLFPKKGRAAED